MKTRLIVLVMCLCVAGGLLAVVPAQADVGELPNPEIYLTYGTAAVTSVITPIAVNSVTLTETFQVEGRMFWKGPEAAEGTFLVTAGALSQRVEVLNLQLGEVYSDSNGVCITANAEGWGRSGIVVYQPEDGRRVYTLAGYGYSLVIPAGTLFWNFATEMWQVEPIYGFFTVVSVLEQVPEPDPTPTPEPQEEFQVFLPLVSSDRPPACLENTPFEVTGWQMSVGYGVCSQEQPTEIDGTAPIRVQHERYNWLYPEVFGSQAAKWLSPGSFQDDLVSVSTETQAGLVVVCGDCQGFRRIYAVWGLGYQLLYWPNKANWYDGSSWVSEPQWGEYTLIGIR